MKPLEIFYMHPPATSGTYACASNDVDASAESLDWTSGLSLTGSVILYCEALAKDIYVRFGSTQTTATTSKNGRALKADSVGAYFHVDPVAHRYIDHIASASGGTLKVFVVSQMVNRRDM